MVGSIKMSEEILEVLKNMLKVDGMLLLASEKDGRMVRYREWESCEKACGEHEVIKEVLEVAVRLS